MQKSDHVTLSEKATAILALSAEKDRLFAVSQEYNFVTFDLVRKIKEYSLLQQDALNKMADIDDAIAKIAFSQLENLN